MVHECLPPALLPDRKGYCVPLVAQARVLLALGWQSCLLRPPAQLQRAPPALPNALHGQCCIAVPVQPGCGAGVGVGLAALPLLLPLVGWVSSASWSASVRLLRLAGGGVTGPGSQAAGCVASWLLHGACGGLLGATTGHRIRPRTGWPRSWLQAGRTRRGSTCPAGGFQPAGLRSGWAGCCPARPALSQAGRGATLPCPPQLPVTLDQQGAGGEGAGCCEGDENESCCFASAPAAGMS
ncbi:hypothetical protein HaLaN_17066 [Haematococcus lacustris]|uniref:Uncharacterized protein n=1 Tax=Haematococcus lacustris TaxID=44745 RepID=A0A699ZBG2_HAELA|nr:hypothetical protein HaLaN_17066 [Haematococcus lacustris]